MIAIKKLEKQKTYFQNHGDCETISIFVYRISGFYGPKYIIPQQNIPKYLECVSEYIPQFMAQVKAGYRPTIWLDVTGSWPEVVTLVSPPSEFTPHI